MTLLFGGAWINRATEYTFSNRSTRRQESAPTIKVLEDGENSYEGDDIKPLSTKNRSLSPSLLPSQENKWRQRQLRLLGWCKTVETPNTAVFRNRLLSRLLHKFPFLVEAWYWALIYWVWHTLRSFNRDTDSASTGISTRSGLHCSYDRRRHGQYCAETCSTSDSS